MRAEDPGLSTRKAVWLNRSLCFFWLAWFGASSAVADDGGVGAPQASPDQASAQASGALGAPSGTNPATTAPATALAMDQGASSAAEARVAALTARRARVLALLDGTLDTQFAAADVLRVPLDDVDLVGEGGQRFFALLERLRAEAGLADAARRRAEQARARGVYRGRVWTDLRSSAMSPTDSRRC